MRLKVFTAPFRFAVHFLLPVVRGPVLSVAVLGVIAAFCNALGLLALIPLIGALTGGRDELSFRSFNISLDPVGLLGLFGAALVLVLIGMQLRLVIQVRANRVMNRVAEEASIRGLLRLRELAKRAPDAGLERHVPALIGHVSYACGFLMRQFANSLADLMRFCVFLMALTWLNPWLTLLLMVLSVGALTYYSRAVSRVVTMAGERKAIAAAARNETREVQALFADATDAVELCRKLENFFECGALGSAMRQRSDLRNEMQRGPLVIEGLLPLLLLMFVVLALTTDTLSEQAAPLLVSLILIRGLVGQMQRLSGIFIAIGRHHASLGFYELLHTTSDSEELNKGVGEELIDQLE